MDAQAGGTPILNLPILVGWLADIERARCDAFRNVAFPQIAFRSIEPIPPEDIADAGRYFGRDPGESL